MWWLAGLLRYGVPHLRDVMHQSVGEPRGGMTSGLPTATAAVMAVALLFLAGPALAQQGNTGLFWQCAPPSSAQPNGGYCPVNTTYPLPQGPAVLALTPVPGTQENLTISTSTALTVPAGATVALIQAQGTNNSSGQCLFWQDDGTAPTGTTGQALPAYEEFYYRATNSGLRLIAATGATCTATISYYK